MQPLHAQWVSLDWARQTQDQTENAGVSMVVQDHSGNTVVSGGFRGTMDLDPGPGIQTVSTGGNGDVFLQKFDPSGNLIFAFQLGATGNSASYGLVIGPNDDIYLSGIFAGNADFDPGTGVFMGTAGPVEDGFVWHLDAAGSFVSAFFLPGNNGTPYPYIALDSTGNIVVSGFFTGTVDLDPGPGTFTVTETGLADIFLVKFSPTGIFRWGRQWGSQEFDRSGRPIVNSNGEILIAGLAAGMDLDPGPGMQWMVPLGTYDMYFCKLDSNGNFLKGGHFGGDGGFGGDGLAEYVMDANGNYYFGGNFDGFGDFDPGPGSVSLNPVSSFYNFYLVKLDANLDLVFAGSIPYLLPRTIAVDALGRMLVAFQIQDTVDLDPGIAVHNVIPTGLDDIVVASYDPNLAYRDHLQIGGPGIDQAQRLYFAEPNTLYIGGEFSDTVDADPSPSTTYLITSDSTRAAWVAKYALCWAGTAELTLGDCDSILLNDSTYFASGTYYQHLSGMGGCDSLVVLHAHVGPSPVTQLVATACTSYTLGSQTYVASGAYTQLLTNVYGCDSVVQLQLTIDTMPDVTIVQNQDLLIPVQLTGTFQWMHCDSGYVSIPGGTWQTMWVQANGSYAVEITVGSCVDTSACIPMIVIGILEANLQPVLFPNPTAGSIHIRLSNPFPDALLQICDVLGRVVHQSPLPQTDDFEIDLPPASGTYFVTLSTAGQQFHWKVLKQ